jgi:hypothetical protein
MKLMLTAVAARHALACRHHGVFAFVQQPLSHLHEAWKHEPLVVALGGVALILLFLFVRKL